MLELTLTLLFCQFTCSLHSCKKEMLEESHKKNCEEVGEGLEVDLETAQLKYTLLQIRCVVFGPPEADDASYDSEEEQEELTLDDVLLWVGLHWIESCVTKKVFRREVKNGTGFWEWVTVSDVAYVLMILDLHYEVQKQAWVREHTREEPAAATVLNTAMRDRYAEYKKHLTKIIEEKGGGAWKRQFNDKFRKEEDSLRKKETKTTPLDASKDTGEKKKESNLEWLLSDLETSMCPTEAVEV